MIPGPSVPHTLSRRTTGSNHPVAVGVVEACRLVDAIAVEVSDDVILVRHVGEVGDRSRVDRGAGLAVHPPCVVEVQPHGWLDRPVAGEVPAPEGAGADVDSRGSVPSRG